MMNLQEQIALVEKLRKQLKKVLDPELNINVVDLGLIYDISLLEENMAEITMTLTTPGCPLHDSIVGGVKHCVLELDEIEKVNVQLVWEPAWTPDRMSEDGLRAIGR